VNRVWAIAFWVVLAPTNIHDRKEPCFYCQDYCGIASAPGYHEKLSELQNADYQDWLTQARPLKTGKVPAGRGALPLLVIVHKWGPSVL
jgi:hypothetical protein